jgi:hypothetical protein
MPEFNDRRTNAKPFMGQKLTSRDINPNSRASVPAKGAGIKGQSDYVNKVDAVSGSIAKGKTTLRREGIYNYANEGVKIMGSSSKMKRAAAKLAGKPPVNKRKPK